MKILITTASLIFVCTLPAEASSSDRQYLNLWVAEIRGGEEVARRVARDHGFNYNGPYDPFEDHYEFSRDDHPEVSPRHSRDLSSRLMDLQQVEWAEQQSVVKRSLRGNIPKAERTEEEQVRGGSGQGSGESRKVVVPNEIKKKPGSFDKIPTRRFSTRPAEESCLNMYPGPTRRGYPVLYMPSPYDQVFNDPGWLNQWYVQDYRTWNGPLMNHNVVPVYERGYTGEGRTVMVVDGDIEPDHPDLKDNFLEDLTTDFCKRKFEPPSSEDDHGTNCAGVIAMVADNGVCGVGIAYNAKVAGSKVTCVFGSESKALVSHLDKVDVYSCSIGPEDNGMLMDTVGCMKDKAIRMGIEKGRKGKGAIYVFAAGNGRNHGDNCAADGTINHIGVIGITSADEYGRPTWYGERCSAVVATTYSGNYESSGGITATSHYGGCTNSFYGTSASTPIASGIITLVLESKPELTYRDVMHLIAWTSEVAPLADNENSWYRNGRGIWVSNDFGFGLLNAENMVLMAKHWQTVPKKKKCVIKMKPKDPVRFRTAQFLNITIDTKACLGKDQEVLYLEQIELTSTVEYPYRGALKMYTTSPAGTETLLLQPRLRDKNKFGLYEWNIKSVHNWGEDPRGKWTISVQAISLIGLEDAEVVAHKFVLSLHGTADKPAHYNLPRRYAAFRLPDGNTPWTKK